MEVPMDYSLCCQRVTLYRPEGALVRRQTLDNCFYQYKTVWAVDSWGARPENRFLLIVPGQADLRPGDRVAEGDGPAEWDWASLQPGITPGVSEVAYVRFCPWEGQICHTEAGR